ncbi:response regulator transcription factor [Paenibacillus aceris]|uniref:Two-component system response regulator YesN n=1 Tax=Paenibacillus aceris TaxID=869555 RepID=A0ABS4HW77_9BACL|nr:response regulator [Paenibacillus aceris]MBP1962805.1 two-component system response regulator YesN [Paenibacillus aceris]NHW38235.1 response regulator [Paenibacillus aceris]
MINVFIVDDEPKIRRKIRQLLDWESLGMEIVGEAEDGEMALELAQTLRPDLLLVDICIPIMNGLELVEKVNHILPHSVVILITGHDEFTFAHQAVKLSVFDYLLKPVRQEELEEVVLRAKKQLEQFSFQNKYMNWANNHLTKNFTSIRDRFLNEWVNGQLSEIEVREQLDFFNIRVPAQLGMMLIKVTDRLMIGQGFKEWDRQLLLFAVQNVAEEIVSSRGQSLLFRDAKDHVVVLMHVNDQTNFETLAEQVTMSIEQFLKCNVHIIAQQREQWCGIPNLYGQLVQEMMVEEHWSPIVLLSKKYIDTHYHLETFSLQDVAKQFQISPAYISRLLRQELGATFIDYLTKIRIKRAIQLMNDPSCKMYEVAEKVGYSSQHYFSTAFKKIVGISPTEYRRSGANPIDVLI